MDIEQYLQIEFEVYPRRFRDVAIYLAKKEALSRITDVPQEVACTKCEKHTVKVCEEASKGGVRYRYTCTSCGHSHSNYQKTIYLAYWEMVSANAMMEDCPLIDQRLFNNHIQKWERKNIVEQQGNLMLWNSSLTWLKWVWKQHKSTPDYKALKNADSLIVEAIGFIIEGLRKSLKKKIEDAGVDLYDPRFQSKMKDCDEAIKMERKRYYPQYQSNLSPVFRYKIKEQLSIG